MCQQTKKIEEFAKRSGSKYRTACKSCYNLIKKQKRYEVSVKEQKCLNCEIVKEASDFNLNARKKSGLSGICRKCASLKNKKRYNLNPGPIKEKTISYYHNNKSKIREYRRNKQKEKLKTDKIYKLKRRLRNRLYYALLNKGWKKNCSFSKYIGCTYEELIQHLEKRFKPGMTWDNTEKWSIDHIIPLSSAQTEEQIYKLSHYTNLQPLWENENKIKGDKIHYSVKPIPFELTKDYILNIHYAKRMPRVQHSFGLYANDLLVGIITYGKPAASSVAKSLVQDEYINSVIELNRLCLKNNLKNEASMLIARSLKLLPKDTIVISFADTAQDHVGTIYQATNFKYYGLTKATYEVQLKSDPNRHSLGIYDESKGQENRAEYLKLKYGENLSYRKRSQKHRYIYCRNHKLYEIIKLKELPYPKINT